MNVEENERLIKKDNIDESIPDKCTDCKHAVIAFESVHQGWCRYQMETAVRCDCNPVRYRVGCACAEMYCEKRRVQE